MYRLQALDQTVGNAAQKSVTVVQSAGESAETVPNVTGGHHFFGVFVQSYFLIMNMRVAIEEEFVFCYVFLLLLKLTGLGLGLNILVFFPSLVISCVNVNRKMFNVAKIA